MQMDKIDAIILDVDGTIWDTTELAAGAWNKAIDCLHLDLPRVEAAVLRREFGKPMDEIADDLWPALAQSDKRQLLRLCERKEQEDLEQSEVSPYPRVLETVARLSARKDFFVVSNCQAGYIELMAQKTGLGAYIKDFECFGRTGLLKAANITLLAARNHLVHPVYVGDTRGDAASCAQAGLPFIWAAWGFGKEGDFAGLPVAARAWGFGELATLFGEGA